MTGLEGALFSLTDDFVQLPLSLNITHLNQPTTMSSTLARIGVSNWQHVDRGQFDIHNHKAEGRSGLQKARVNGRRCLVRAVQIVAHRDSLWHYLDALRYYHHQRVCLMPDLI
jgi:hypothetical protein